MNPASGHARTDVLRDRHLIGVIGDQDTVTGMLLAGIGNIDSREQRNFLIVDQNTSLSQISETFTSLVGRKDIGILLITQPVAELIRAQVDAHRVPFPALLEIPAKDAPYDPAKDSLLQRVSRMYSAE